ncbi:hypothetical protein GUJ93_ZPchr0006g45488 [Zizania palustris]|uniref:Uncharacterized protein n=1 Tax=Zizania palustris TaxID=103762 RepID=A0A8J5W2F7_ZIZPA|nr:hypothetical protein GUJ93_ZPchr0006g45488 [Zizania palustris]
MDGVELPLPAKVDFGKVLTSSAVEGLDGGGGGGGGAGGGDVLRRCADADRRHGDVKQHGQNADSISSYRSKGTSLEVSMQKSLALSIKSEINGKRDYVGTDTSQSLHKQDSKKNAPELMQCTPSEKSRLLKQKRIYDAKRIDKKNFRSGVRSKYDCFTSRTNLGNFDSGFLGNSMLGMHGLKSDIRDITNHIENLSLSELLNGTYKYSSLGREKGKKVLRTKDELLVSVRKAFSMLSGRDCSYGMDANFLLGPKLPTPSTSSCDGKDQCNDKLMKEPSQIEVCDTTLHCPKDILNRLTLPQGQDLDSLLSSGNESSAAVKPSLSSVTTNGASLPPFPWTLSQAGGYRLGADCGKHGSSRSNSQWQWVRVGSNLTALDCEDSSVHKIDDLLQEMDTAKSSIMDSYGKPSNLCGTESTSGSPGQILQSRKKLSEHNPQQLFPMDNGDSSDSFQKHDSERFLLRTPQASPKVLHAAEILCDMRSTSDAWSAQGYGNGTMKGPKSPSEKAMKARKPSSPFGTTESSSGSRNSDVARTRNNHSKKIVDVKNDSVRMNNPGKGSIRWPVPIEDGAPPVKPERSLMLDTRQQTHGNAARHPVQVARLEKEYENQQKLRKATLTSSLGSTGDWSRDRNKRM